MKKTTLLIASCGLASGLAMAAQQEDTGAYNPDPEMTQDQSDYGTARPADPSDTMGQHEQQTSDYGTEQTDPAYQADTSQSHGMDDLSAMAASDLEGKSVTTATGEEIGEIDEVWTSNSNDERIVTVEVGGFLGIGEKTIAIPLSDLHQAAADDSLQTSMTRGTIEAHPEFDEAGYTREGEDAEQGLMEDDDSGY